MNGLAGALLVATFVIAAIDWFAVHTDNRPIEYFAKPATMVALIGTTLALDVEHSSVRAWFVAALALSLAGDVFLMLPQDLFVFGLGSFLLGHLAYIAGLWSADTSGTGLVVGIGVVLVLLPVLGTRILRAVRGSSIIAFAKAAGVMYFSSGSNPSLVRSSR